MCQGPNFRTHKFAVLRDGIFLKAGAAAKDTRKQKYKYIKKVVNSIIQFKPK